ncbi:hypothetical protein ACFU8I_07065 [Streptomyces sp. NPDC057540]|uniref:hypothetical protein n=1 Tax=Streptomyces sp. NPDC057540 TaxID=3346160 RepID=UPI0036923815
MPTRVNRAAHTAVGLAPGAGLLGYGAEASAAPERAVAVAAFLACVGLAVRGYRAGVRCEENTVRLRRRAVRG